jgi:hypothetical protein
VPLIIENPSNDDQKEMLMIKKKCCVTIDDQLSMAQ